MALLQHSRTIFYLSDTTYSIFLMPVRPDNIGYALMLMCIDCFGLKIMRKLKRHIAWRPTLNS